MPKGTKGFQKGHKGYKYWKGKKLPNEVKQKISNNSKGQRRSLKTEFKNGSVSFWKGKKLSEEHKQKLRESHRKNPVKYWLGKKRENMTGEKNPSWEGGKSFEKYTVDWTETLKRSIRERDHYICQLCGNYQENIALAVHHIDYNKHNCDPKNLICLCSKCHIKTNFDRDYWKDIFTKKISTNS